MSDKPLVQQALATDLANILLSIPSTDAALAFLQGFWTSLVREWAGIDRLRCVHRLLKHEGSAFIPVLLDSINTTCSSGAMLMPLFDS